MPSLEIGHKEKRQVIEGKLQLVFVRNHVRRSKTNGRVIGDYGFSVNN
jgi:hypothetical protein